jgi:hypothetical protein
VSNVFRPSSARRERSLLFGAMGTGKTNALVSILHRIRASGSDAQCFWLDTDNVADVYGVEEEGAIVYPVWEWGDYVRALDSAWAKVNNPEDGRCEDCLFIDRANLAWPYVIQDWIGRTQGKTMEEFFAKSVDTAYKDVSWNQVNTAYDGVMKRAFLRWPGHVFVTASEEDVKREGTWADSAKVQADFRSGKKPAGQKDLAYQLLSVIWMQEKRSGEYVYTSIKDLRREKPVGAEVGDFSVSYLADIAGWEL